MNAVRDHILSRLAPLGRIHEGMGAKWRGRCPACANPRPTLCVTEKPDRILLHCFACHNLKAICDALGIAQRDLYANPITRETTARREDVPRPSIRDDITGELELYQLRNGLFEQRLFTYEINAITAEVAKRRELAPAPLPIPLWDFSCGGLERDSSWPDVFWYALHRASIEILREPLNYDPASRRTGQIPHEVLLRAEDIATQIMRGIERETSARARANTLNARKAA
jgi:hypothetical protein